MMSELDFNKTVIDGTNINLEYRGYEMQIVGMHHYVAERKKLCTFVNWWVKGHEGSKRANMHWREQEDWPTLQKPYEFAKSQVDADFDKHVFDLMASVPADVPTRGTEGGGEKGEFRC